ncbi:MAG TPA: hypothetical protein PK567_04730 [Bacillota bacterium]|nr:hypothetical protein [Bacillota bacterium]
MRKGSTLQKIAWAFLAMSFLCMVLTLVSGIVPSIESSDVHVICLEDEGDSFPRMDYQILFSNADIEAHFYANRQWSADDIRAKVTKLCEKEGATSVVLFAKGENAYAALEAAVDNSMVSDVILLSPVFDENANMDRFGMNQPSASVAVFDGGLPYAHSLYERLSGEDTLFTRGIQYQGLFSTECFISPDATRYLSVTDMVGNATIASDFHVENPVVQTQIYDYLQHYINEETSSSRPTFWYWMGKTTGVFFGIIGILLFAATVPKPKKRTVDASGSRADSPTTDAPAAVTQGRPVLKTRPISEKYAAKCMHCFWFSLLLSFLFGCLSVVALLIDVRFAKLSVLCGVALPIWFCALMSWKYMTGKSEKRRVSRNTMITTLMLIFTILSLWLINSVLWSDAWTVMQGAITIIIVTIVSIFLFIGTWVLMRIDTKMDPICAGTGVFRARKFIAVRFVPFVPVLLFSVIIDKGASFFDMISLMLLICVIDFLRIFIHNQSSKEAFAAFTYAGLFFMIMLF